jgi:hypothetical protein
MVRLCNNRAYRQPLRTQSEPKSSVRKRLQRLAVRGMRLALVADGVRAREGIGHQGKLLSMASPHHEWMFGPF